MSNLEALTWTDTNGLGVRTLLLNDSGVAAVDKLVADLRSAHGSYAAKNREVAAARTEVERLGDSGIAEARAAGKKLDAKKIRAKATATRERLDDLLLEREVAAQEVAFAHADYLNGLSHYAPALVERARAEVTEVMHELTTALTFARSGAARLQAATTVLTGLHGIAEGRAEPANVRTAADDLNDGGLPSIWASLAEEPLVKAIAWAQRHLDYATEWEREQAALAEANRLEAERVAEFDRIEAERIEAERVAEAERLEADPEAAKEARKAAKKAAAKAEAEALAAYKFATE